MLELGKRITALLTQARAANSDIWVGHGFNFHGQPDWHAELVEALTRWEDEFNRAELSVLPDGWAKMACLLPEWRNMLGDPFGPVEDPPGVLKVRVRHAIATGELRYVPYVVRDSRRAGAVRFGRRWRPIWAKLWPAIEKRIGLPKAVPGVGTVAQRFAALFEANRTNRNYSVTGREFEAITTDGFPLRWVKSVNLELARLGSEVRVEGSTPRHGLVRTFKPSAFRLKPKKRRKSPPAK